MSAAKPGSRSLTERGRALVAAGVTLAAAGVALGFVDLTRIGMLVGILPFLALALTHLSRPRLEVHRALPVVPLTPGCRSEIVLQLRSRCRRLTQPALGEDQLSDGLGGATRFFVPALAPNQCGQARYLLCPARRGLQVLGPLTVRYVDPFGLATSTDICGEVDEVVVVPPIVALTGRSSGAGGELGAMSTPRLSGVHGEVDAAIRQYRRGDDLRRIHWPVTAHRGALMVRQEAHPTLHRAVIFLDPSRVAEDAATDDNGPAQVLLDWAVAALASVAVHLRGQGFAVHVLTPQTCTEDAAGAPLSTAEAVRALAVVEPGPPVAAGAVEDPLLTITHELASGGGMLVTAVSATGGERAREVLGTRPPGVPAVVFVLDPGSSAAPGEASSVLSSGRSSSPAVQFAAFASAGGWRATVVDERTAVADAWADSWADSRADAVDAAAVSP